MDTLNSKVAGLDVHLRSIQCAIRCRQPTGKLLAEVRSFGTMTRDLRALADHLGSWGVTHVALEATGVLWKPVWNVLSEGESELMVANAAHIKNVSQFNNASRPAAVVSNVRHSRVALPLSMIRTQATIVPLCTSRPSTRPCITSIVVPPVPVLPVWGGLEDEV